MRIGVMLPFQQPIGQWQARRVDEIVEVTRLARDLDFHYICASQHYLASPCPFLQPIPLLARVAGEAGDLTLALDVILLPLQNPVDIAEQLATLDILCRGRTAIGFGLGYREEQNQALGIPAQARLGRFLEAFALLKRLWTEEETTFEGKHFRLIGVRNTLRPLQQPHPPFWLAGNADSSVRRAARLGDAWAVSGRQTQTTIAQQIEIYRAARREAHLPLPGQVVAIRDVHVAPSRAAALEISRVFLRAKYESVARWGHHRVLPATDNLDVPFDQLIQGRSIIGTPEDACAELQRYADLGISDVMIQCMWPGMDFRDGLASIRLFGQEVLPHVRALRPSS